MKFSLSSASAIDGKTRATLLERLRNGADTLAWDEFFRRYWHLIYLYARRCDCSEHTAEEVVQDVMLKVFEQRDCFQYDPTRGRFRDWLGAVVRNKVAQLRRKPVQRVQVLGNSTVERLAPTHENKPEEVWEKAFEESLLLVLLDVVRREMTPRAYLAFELFVLQRLPGAKVAKQTGLTRNAVYRAHKRALQRLRELGAGYRDDGQLGERIKQALLARPSAAVEQSLTTRLEKHER